ncbi:hypothetical protein [Agrobacterium larrymoorei]|uniref:hypothetical protein n=1 Tax=Agrobacterium larrymoorei TaxID=160699 RepID=UPI0030EE17B1
MLAFLQDNAPIVSAAASIGTLCIWAVYLHIFVGGHQRQIKPMLVINRSESRTLDARCLVTNMSREPVHVQSVVATVRTASDTHAAHITDAEDIRSSGTTTGWQRMTRQGPLAAGTMVDMGTFACILDYATRSCSEDDRFLGSKLETQALSLEITILGIYGTEDLLVGASRVFEFDHTKTPVEIRATTALTRQITKKRERKRLLRELDQQL